MPAICEEEKLSWFYKRQLLAALKLELYGLKHSGGSVYAKIKREFGLRGSRSNVYNQFHVLVEESRPL